VVKGTLGIKVDGAASGIPALCQLHASPSARPINNIAQANSHSLCTAILDTRVDMCSDPVRQW